MSDIVIPKNYKSQLNLYETQVAIKTVKDFFQGLLAERLHLLRVSAPLFVDPTSGLNDNLNGVERPVNFHIAAQGDREAEIVQSLAKWKRYALQKYGFQPGEGLYTDMSAIRQDEETDNIHSIYVDRVGLGKDHHEGRAESGDSERDRPHRIQGSSQDREVYVHPLRLHRRNPSS